MQFVIIGLDGKDEQAPARRLAVRQQHIALSDELVKNGNLWYGAALLNNDGTMKGSIYIMNFDNQTDFDEYLNKEPYVLGKVWQDVTVHKSNTRNPWQFNHAKEWYIDRGANSN